MKQFYRVVAASLLVVFCALPTISSAQTMTTAQVQAEVRSLLAQIQSLQQQLVVARGGTTATWCHIFSANLEVGDTSPDVTALQQALSKDGETVSVTGTFDDQTASAVTGFQQKYASQILAPSGLQNGTGYVGKATRAKLNSLFGCNNPTPSLISTLPPPSGSGPALTSRTALSIPPMSTAGSPTLNITLDPYITPQTQSVNPGGTGYILLVADLTAGPTNIVVSSLNFGCGGYVCNAVDNLKMASVGANPQTWTGTAANSSVFTPNLTIPAGTTQAVELIGDLSPSAEKGQEMDWSLTSNLVNLANGGSVTGQAWGNMLTVSGQSNFPSANLTVNGSGGPITVSSGSTLNVTWNSSGIPQTCYVNFNPTGAGTYGIGTGLSGSATVSAPDVSVPGAFLYQLACPAIGLGGPSWSDTVQVDVMPGATTDTNTVAQPTFNATPTTIFSGATTTFSWANIPIITATQNFFGTANCAPGITIYDVTNNQNFACGDVDRTVPVSGSDVLQLTSNPNSTQVPFILQYGNGQSLTETITVYPAIQPITVTATGLGQVSGRAKQISDWLGALNFRAGTGWVAINKVTVTLGGSIVTMGSSTFLNPVQLLDQNDNSVVTADGAMVSVNIPAGTVTWTFPSGASGFTIPQYESYSFTLNVNSTSVPPEQGVAETLTAQVLNASDVQYSTASQMGLTLPPSEVPITVNSVAYLLGS
jgi:hypothetical protein